MAFDVSVWLTKIARVITSNSGNWVLSLSILVVALLVYWGRFRPKCRRLLRQLNAKNAWLDGFGSQVEFARRFEEANIALGADPVLAAPWKRLQETLLFPAAEDRRQTIKNTADPEAYFNRDSIVQPFINLRFYTGFPNYLTGAGILGTFVGLVFGIYLASHGLTDPDLDKVKTALQNLLNGASLAFLTSICGLVASIIFSVSEKRALHKIENAIGNWNDKLNGLFERVTLEKLAALQVAESARQSLQLERFNTELAVTIADALQSKISTSLGPSLDRLVHGVEDLGQNYDRAQQGMLDSLVRQFKESLTGAAGNEMASMQATFQELTSGLRQAVTSIQDGQKQLVDATTTMTTNLGGTMVQNIELIQEKMGATVEMLGSQLKAASVSAAQSLKDSGESTSKLLGSASDRLTEAIHGLSPIVDKTAGMLTAYGSAVEQFQEITSQLRQIHDAMARSVGAVTGALEQLKSASGQLAGGAGQVAGASQAIQRAAEQIGASQTATASAWSQYEARFAQIDGNLKRVFEQINTAQHQHAEQASRFVQEMDKELGKAVETLSAVVRELMEIAETLQESKGR